MTQGVGDLNQIKGEIDDVIKTLKSDPIPKDAPLLYEEMCISIYGVPDHYGGDTLFIKHTCRDDLGVVMVKKGSPIHKALMEVVE